MRYEIEVAMEMSAGIWQNSIRIVMSTADHSRGAARR